MLLCYPLEVLISISDLKLYFIYTLKRNHTLDFIKCFCRSYMYINFLTMLCKHFNTNCLQTNQILIYIHKKFQHCKSNQLYECSLCDIYTNSAFVAKSKNKIESSKYKTNPEVISWKIKKQFHHSPLLS